MRRALLVLFAVGMIAGFGSAFGRGRHFHHWGCHLPDAALPTAVSAAPISVPPAPVPTTAMPIIVQSPQAPPAQVIVVMPQGAVQAMAPVPATNVAPATPVP